MITDHLTARLDAWVFGRVHRSVGGALSAFGALALPSSCVVCGRWDTSLCARCSGTLRRATARPFRAEEAAESLPDVEIAAPDHRAPLDARRSRDGRGALATDVGGGGCGTHQPLPVIAAGRYVHAVSAVLLAYKNHGHVDLAGPLAAALAGALHRAVSGGAIGAPPGEPVLLVPVPSRAAARRRRGYDPLMLLLTRLDRGGLLPAGTRLAPWLGHVLPVVRIAVALREGRAGPAGRTAVAAVTAGMFGGQKGAGRRRRRTNVLHSMVLPGYRRKDVAGRACLIIDDVLTTGATIGEAHRALSAAGALVLGAVVVAATRSPSGEDHAPAPAAAVVPGSRPGSPRPTPMPQRPTPTSPGGQREVPVRQGMNKGGC